MDAFDLAAPQRGVVHRCQLLAQAISDDTIFRLVRKGDLVPVFPSVYRIRGATRSWMQLVTAASLWAGEGSAITGPAAAAIYKVDGFGHKGRIDVVTERRLRSPRADVHIRRVGELPVGHVHERCGIRLVSGPRLFLDLSTGDHDLEKMLEAILRQGICSEEDIKLFIQGVPTGTRGLARSKRALRDRQKAATPTASDLETECLQALRRGRAPSPVRQHWILDGSERLGRIDLAYPGARLGIEVDSYEWHGDFRSFHRDRERYNSVVALGWKLLLFTKRTDPRRFAAQVIRILAERQGSLL